MCTVIWDRLAPIPGGRLLRHRDTDVGPRVWQMSQFRRWKWLICYICSNKLSFVYVNYGDFPISHSSIVAPFKNWGSYSSTWRLWVLSMMNLLSCREHSIDQNSLWAVPGLWPHTSRRSTHFLQEFGWEVFNHHPPYNPDLAPSDFHLFFFYT